MVKARKARAPRIGRPPVADADRRETLVRVLTTGAERAELQRAAASVSMSVSTWVRSVALERARRKLTQLHDELVDLGLETLLVVPKIKTWLDDE